MKWIFSICVFFLMLGCVIAQQTNSSHGRRNDEVIKELKAKAEKGDAESQELLGMLYSSSTGLNISNDVESVEWYLKAAKQGNSSAQYALGRCYMSGIGVVQDQNVAVMWIRKAADQGDAQASNALGLSYLNGWGVTKDSVEAVKLFRNSIDAMNPSDVFKDDRLIQKVLESCHAESEYNLGYCYANGEGVTKDYVEADKWFNLASAQGSEDAKKYLPTIEQLMTPYQIAEAQQLAREYTPRKQTGSGNSASPAGPKESGSGFFITDDGYLISNNHVVKDATKVRLVTSAGTINAKVIQVDAANDLALLKAVGRFAPLPILSSKSAHLGGTVATIGFPDPTLQGFSPKLAKGEIASLSGAADDPRYFQISVPVQPGNSGGALVDERGNVIGIVSAKLDASTALAMSGSLPENVNYAVKSSLLLSFLESVPDVANKLKAPNTADEKFEEVVKSAQGAAVLVLVY
jgi:S1-C subfamily serine protease